MQTRHYLKFAVLVCFLLPLFLVVSLQPVSAQQAREPYWEYVNTESGVVPYDPNGCYQPRIMTAQEGLVEITITHCGNPPEAQTTYRLEWTTPPQVIYPNKPFDFKLKATLLANANPRWTLPGGLGISFTNFVWDPATQWGPISVGPQGNPHTAGETFIWDNLSRPLTEQYAGPPQWWATDSRYAHPSRQIRLFIGVSASNKHWWSYVYRLVEPGKEPLPQTGVFAGNWTGQWQNNLGEQGPDSLVLTEDELGNLRGTWSGKIAVSGRKLTATTGELQGQTATRNYQGTITIQGNVLTFTYVARRLNAAGGYEGRSRFTRAK